jgi:cytochrome c-type biogenesis protein CcmF
VLGVAGATAAVVLLPLSGPSSPFRALSPAPLDGLGVAPLLQDHLLMLAHPPTLYGGQAGLLVPFAVALLGLARGRLERSWRQVLRRWLLAAWALLTAGLLLGAWWAYAVLGWGGFWAWDPVENAAFIPWLFATAALHALRLAELERRGEGLAAGLTVGAYATALLGGYLTRSGAVDSVHAFARTSTAWVFLVPPVAAVAAALAARLLSPDSRAAAHLPRPWLSRGGLLTLGALLLAALALLVLAGTIFPLGAALFGHDKLGVARPYYDHLAAPTALLALLLLGAAPALRHGRALRTLPRALAGPIAAALLTLAGCLSVEVTHPAALATFALSAFALVATWPRGALYGATGPGLRRLGAWACHAGFLVAVSAIAGASALGSHVETSALPGETFAVGGHRVRYHGLVTREEPHRRWVAAVLSVEGAEAGSDEGGARLTFYPRREQPLSKPFIHATVAGDVYVSLGGFEPESKRAGFAAWEFPLMSWLWVSLPLLLGGALLALASPRRREARALAAPEAVPPGTVVTAPGQSS